MVRNDLQPDLSVRCQRKEDQPPYMLHAIVPADWAEILQMDLLLPLLLALIPERFVALGTNEYAGDSGRINRPHRRRTHLSQLVDQQCLHFG